MLAPMGNAVAIVLARAAHMNPDFDAQIQITFKQADKNGNGRLDPDEFDNLVDNLGKVLTGLIKSAGTTWQVQDLAGDSLSAMMAAEKRDKEFLFTTIDRDSDGGISLSELQGYVYYLLENGEKPPAHVMSQMDAQLFAQAVPVADLQSVFNTFCAFGAGKGKEAEMDNAKFAKFCRDTKLLDKKFTATDADLLFSKSKPAGQRKLTYRVFSEKVIPAVAQKKGVDADALVNKICGAGGPHSSGTKAQDVKYHDDKSLYTGVYARGGPTNVDKDKVSLAGLVSDHNALTCDVRGVIHH